MTDLIKAADALAGIVDEHCMGNAVMDGDEFLVNMLTEALTAYRSARESAGEVWHSADLREGLETGESYLIYLDGGVQITALWVGKWMTRGEVVYPTHWRQLPEPPRILSALADTE